MQHAWRAAWVLAAVLLVGARPRPETQPTACPQPAERAARDGHSIRAGCSGGAPLRGPARRLFGLPLDPNRADAPSLEILPGIGPARARAIVAERCLKPFGRLSELQRVPGIGPRTLESIADQLALEDPTEVGPEAEKPIACPGEQGRAQ